MVDPVQTSIRVFREIQGGEFKSIVEHARSEKTLVLQLIISEFQNFSIEN